MTHEDHEFEDPQTVIDDDGHTLADITPWSVEATEADELLADETNRPDDPDEYLNWDRERDGRMVDYVSADEPVCRSGDACEKGV